jgi:hypothetical protein
MSDDDFTTSGGLTADHPIPRGLPLYVAPTDANDVNTIRVPLAPIACWRLNDVVFAFDSSFIGPGFAGEFTKLATLVAANQGAPASLFAHADPVGSDDVNKTISDRRAIAVYAVLTRQPDQWEYLYSHPQDGDTWGTSAIQAMLATIVDGSGNPYYAGDTDGVFGPQTKAAVTSFQTDAGLSPDGVAGPDTRKALFGAYMDLLCVDGSGARFLMKATDFLGGGADPGGKMAMQGCSEFNPVFLLSSDEMAQYQQSGDKASRNKRNGPDRRVVLYLFRPGTQVDPADWPCPRVKESAAPCKGQFWPDGDQRRKPGDAERKYQDTHDTMACRFYDRFARRSPCEGGAPAFLEVDLGLDMPLLIDTLAETFLLVSDDGSYSQERMRAEAVQVSPRLGLVRFTRVKPGLTYSLYECYGGVIQQAIFTSVAIKTTTFTPAPPGTPPAPQKPPEEPAPPDFVASVDASQYPGPDQWMGNS